MVNLSPIEYSWHGKHASINETVIPSLRFLLVLSCLGQAADLVVSITRSSAVGIMLTPPKLERVPTWGSAWPFGQPSRKKGYLRHVSSPYFIDIDLHERSGGVPDTDPDPREACRIREKQTETRVRAPSPHRATRAASIRTPFAGPSTDPISRRGRGVIQRAPSSLKARHGLVNAVTDRLWGSVRCRSPRPSPRANATVGGF